MKFSLRASVLMIATGMSGLAAAQDASSALHLRTTAAMCANCHGTAGKAADGSGMPSLAGTPRETMIAQMKAFKDGSRPATVMHQLAKGFSDAQIEQIAAYFATVR